MIRLTALVFSILFAGFLFCQNVRVRTFSLLLALFLPASLIHASGAGKGHPLPSPSVEKSNLPLTAAALKSSPKAIFQRVIQARLFQAGTWTLAPSQTPLTVARTLASLQPTFVTGLLRLSNEGELTNAEAEAFAANVSAVRAVSKGCRFDVVINAGVEESGASFVRRMKEISTRIHPDAWTFLILPDDDSINPELISEGISQAHSAGQMVGYDGPLQLIPDGVDYIIVRAWNLTVQPGVVEQLQAKHGVPVIVELPTAFGKTAGEDVQSYVDKMTARERAEVLTRLAESQGSRGYRFAYPVFYPIYPARHAFDSTKDETLLVTIRSLLARFD